MIIKVPELIKLRREAEPSAQPPSGRSAEAGAQASWKGWRTGHAGLGLWLGELTADL